MTRQEAIGVVFSMVAQIDREWGYDSRAGQTDTDAEAREIILALVGVTPQDLEEYEAAEKKKDQELHDAYLKGVAAQQEGRKV